MCKSNITQLNPVHTNGCNDDLGYYYEDSIEYIGKSYEAIESKRKIKCKDVVLCFSFGFQIYYMNVGKCVLRNYKAVDIIKSAVDHKFGADLWAKRKSDFIPKWEGEDYVYELVYEGYGFWDYYVKTPIDKIPNIFNTDLETDLIYDNMGFSKNERSYSPAMDLNEKNLDLLKRNEFVSKRATQFELKNADINAILKKVSKQIKQK